MSIPGMDAKKRIGLCPEKSLKCCSRAREQHFGVASEQNPIHFLQPYWESKYLAIARLFNAIPTPKNAIQTPKNWKNVDFQVFCPGTVQRLEFSWARPGPARACPWPGPGSLLQEREPTTREGAYKKTRQNYYMF